MLPSIPPDAIEAERAHRRAKELMQGRTYTTHTRHVRAAVRTLELEFGLTPEAARDLTRIVESDDHE